MQLIRRFATRTAGKMFALEKEMVSRSDENNHSTEGD